MRPGLHRAGSLRQLVVAVVVACSIWGTGCRPDVEPPGSETFSEGRAKVLLLGLDGASWDFMRPMIERGALPNLGRMVREGVHAPMASELPCLSIVLWTTVATGKRPEEHGITGWSFEEESGEKGAMNSSHRRAEALWTIVSRAGGRAGFVNWWATWPAEPVRGYIVSDYFARADPEDDLGEAAFPPDLIARLAPELANRNWPWLSQLIAEGKLKVFSDRQGGDGDHEHREKLAWFFYGQDIVGERAAFHLLETEPTPDLFGHLSRKIDLASHYMWQFATGPDFEAVSRVLEPVYQYEDALLGRLVEAMGPDVNVIVLSDHGFTWEGNELNHTETAPDGIFIAAGPDFKKGVALPRVSLHEVAPTVLHILGLPVGRDMASGPRVDALESDRPVEWVDSHETGADRKARSHRENRLLEQLRSLGYVQ